MLGSFLQRIGNRKKLRNLGLILILTVLILSAAAYHLQNKLISAYQEQNSPIIKDRYGSEIHIQANEKGYWARYQDKVPDRFKSLCLQKEDEYFYSHPGLNPWSIVRAGFGFLGLGEKGGASTITQQLVKILLEKESERNLMNSYVREN